MPFSELPATEDRCRLQHMQHLMHLSRSILWDRVRNLYAAAIEDIQTGQREWQNSLVDLKETLLPGLSTRQIIDCMQNAVYNVTKMSGEGENESVVSESVTERMITRPMD